MATFGYTTHASGAFSDVHNAVAVKFTAPANGTLTAITAWVHLYFGGGNNMRFAVYSDSSGTPNALLASSSADIAVTASDTEYTDSGFSLSITNGTVYWLAMWSDSINAEMAYDTGSTHQTSGLGDGSATYPTWQTTWSEIFALDRVYTIYATYTAGGINPNISEDMTVGEAATPNLRSFLNVTE